MNKRQLVEIVAAEAGVSVRMATRVVSATTDAIIKNLSNNDSVQLVGFGTFRVSKRAARVGSHPKTGQKINIPARNAVSFVAGKGIKDAVN